MIPHLAFLYGVLGNFCTVHGDMERTYRPWFVVIMAVSIPHRSTVRIILRPAFLLPLCHIWLLCRRLALMPSKPFLSKEQVSIRPYGFKGQPAQKDFKDDELVPLKDSLIWLHVDLVLFLLALTTDHC